jgi:hypothetical protein
MSRGPTSRQELKVKRTYEPGRLWQDYLEKAYAQLISRGICVISLAPGQAENWCEEPPPRVEGKAI